MPSKRGNKEGHEKKGNVSGYNIFAIEIRQSLRDEVDQKIREEGIVATEG